MEGPTLSWYQWMSRNGFLSSWPAMLQALGSRFAPSFYDDPHRALFKIHQRGTVNEYLAEFECLANCIVGLTPPFLLGCFISDLNPKLCREVQALQPLSHPQAMALVKLQEDKLQERRRGARSSYFPSTLQTLAPGPSSPHPNPRTPIKRQSSKELAISRDKGLCYHCKDKWYQGHRVSNFLSPMTMTTTLLLKVPRTLPPALTPPPLNHSPGPHHN